MAKANQFARHPLDSIFGKDKINRLPLKKLRKIEERIKKRKRKEKRILNLNGWYKK
jgi:hypothetical protein